jgi:hypothetical protein
LPFQSIETKRTNMIYPTTLALIIIHTVIIQPIYPLQSKQLIQFTNYQSPVFDTQFFTFPPQLQRPLIRRPWFEEQGLVTSQSHTYNYLSARC